jgi:hypothetical protein
MQNMEAKAQSFPARRTIDRLDSQGNSSRAISVAMNSILVGEGSSNQYASTHRQDPAAVEPFPLGPEARMEQGSRCSHCYAYQHHHASDEPFRFPMSRHATSKDVAGYLDFGPPSAQHADEILLRLNGDPWYHSRAAADAPEQGFCPSQEGCQPPPKLNESDAKRQIQLIFRTPACWRSESDQSHLLYLLRQFPSLATQVYDWDYNLFWEHGNEWSSPLSFLLASGADLDTIQSVYELYPDAIAQPQGVHRDLPLHFACRFGVAEDVLSFIVHQFPIAVTVQNSSGMLPIHCAMGKKHIFPYGHFEHARLNTVRLLLDMFPESILVEEKEKFYTPLQIAFNHGYSFEIIDYMIARLPAAMDEFKLMAGCYHKKFSVDLDLAECEMVSKLLPKLERFHCEPTHWTADGLIQLLNYLHINKSIVDFDAFNLPADILLNDSVVEAFKRLLKNNNSLEALGLSVQEGDKLDISSFVDSLDGALEFKFNLQMLELSNFSVTAQSLTRFLANGHAPRVLRVSKFVVSMANEDSEDVRPTVTSNVENLVISDCRLQARGSMCSSFLPFYNLSACVARMPRLKDLTLRSSHLDRIDITDALVQLISNDSLESIAIGGPMVKIGPVCESLKGNKTLRRFDYPATLDTKAKRGLLAETLENHNSTLEYVRISIPNVVHEEVECKKIQYFTRLNQFGRAKVQNPSTTTASFVKLLRNFDTLSLVCRPHDKLAIQYGLLRESPSLWCTDICDESKRESHRGTKRKRGD